MSCNPLSLSLSLSLSLTHCVLFFTQDSLFFYEKSRVLGVKFQSVQIRDSINCVTSCVVPNTKFMLALTTKLDPAYHPTPSLQGHMEQVSCRTFPYTNTFAHLPLFSCHLTFKAAFFPSCTFFSLSHSLSLSLSLSLTFSLSLFLPRPLYFLMLVLSVVTLVVLQATWQRFYCICCC